MAEHFDVFLSYSRNDLEAASSLREQLGKAGISVFFDQESIRAGDLWLNKLQEAVGGCDAFVVLVGRDGVRRWIGAETQVALSRYFGPHDDAKRLPTFPILLGDTGADTLPAFLRLFQTTPWDWLAPLPGTLIEQIRERSIVASTNPFDGCPLVGLSAYRPDQARLFFGRQKESLDALACFNTRRGAQTFRWLDINGNSGSGKSSLMNAGLLPLVDQGWLWPRTGYEHWRRIGPMMPGGRPVEMLAQHLAIATGSDKDVVEMDDVLERLEKDERGLRMWLRSRARGQAFLIAIDQFEELFTFAEREERHRFDGMLAAALDDPDCPLFVVSTVRSGFLDRFGDLLPRLVAVRNRFAQHWTLAPIGEEGLREIITGPARLANLDVSGIEEVMVRDARGEAGALPLVENALTWLWERRAGNVLSAKLYHDQGGIAGLLSQYADDLLLGLGDQRERALDLLFCLVKVDPEGHRHARHRLPFPKAVEIAGGGEAGRRLLDRLAGGRSTAGSVRTEGGPLRLITITGPGEAGASEGPGRAVSLIHETLVRRTPAEEGGEARPYWPTLWNYIERHKDRAAWRERVRVETRSWLENGKKSSYLWSHERVREAATALTQVGPAVDLGDDERAFLGPIAPDAMLVEIKRSETSHERRLLVGERLDVLGDPREGIGLAEGLPDIAWVPIEGGEVMIEIRSDPNDPNSAVETTLTRTVGPFSMARFPVTIAQFQAFLEDCHRDGRWHLPPGFPIDLPDGYQRPRHRSRHANHPADSLNWYDAMAFCHWLSARLGVEVRLPTEFEWQLAATGGNSANIYPWGPDWDPQEEPWRANTYESGLAQVTAVGCYPDGATANGLLDMAGTLWEWCLNEFEDPDAMAFHTERRPRVVRGGSWNYRQDYARCADRYRYSPSYRGDFIT